MMQFWSSRRQLCNADQRQAISQRAHDAGTQRQRIRQIDRQTNRQTDCLSSIGKSIIHCVCFRAPKQRASSSFALNSLGDEAVNTCSHSGRDSPKETTCLAPRRRVAATTAVAGAEAQSAESRRDRARSAPARLQSPSDFEFDSSSMLFCV